MNWTITQIKTASSPVEGTIVNAAFSVTDGVTEVASDVNLLPANAESFVSLEATTEEQVLQWVKDALNANDVEDDISGAEKVELLVTNKTISQAPQITPLPWAE
jgi:hypothetical protein